MHLLENRIFIDVKSAKLLSGGTGADYIDFFVEDPGQVSAITEEIRQIPGIDWKSFAITAHIEDYEKIAGPLADVSVLSDTMLTVIGAMGTAVLSLIQILFHKARGHETGILLSIGISKAEILLQHIAEMAMIALPSLAQRSIYGGSLEGHSAWKSIQATRHTERTPDFPRKDIAQAIMRGNSWIMK